MRLVVWNCAMALHRKLDAVRRLDPDIAVIPECAAPEQLQARGLAASAAPVWVGQNPHKGLAVFAFNGYALRRAEPFHPTLRHLAPVHVDGPLPFNLLAVWAQNASAGPVRKHRLGPLRRGLAHYRAFLSGGPAVVAGDFNNNVIWDRPGWRGNHAAAVAILARLGLVSAYHQARGEAPGRETAPTLYWRDRRQDGPTYHIDYVFLPRAWDGRYAVTVGSFEAWCGSGLSDHVPIIVDVSPLPVSSTAA